MDIVCLRNVSINTLHKGGEEDDDDDDDDDDNNNTVIPRLTSDPANDIFG